MYKFLSLRVAVNRKLHRASISDQNARGPSRNSDDAFPRRAIVGSDFKDLTFITWSLKDFNFRHYRHTITFKIDTDLFCEGIKGKSFEAGGEAAVVESVKAASDVYSPIAGEVTETNDAIVSDPSLVNQDPEGNGWFFKIKVSDVNQINNLMNKKDYDKFVSESA